MKQYSIKYIITLLPHFYLLIFYFFWQKALGLLGLSYFKNLLLKLQYKQKWPVWLNRTAAFLLWALCTREMSLEDFCSEKWVSFTSLENLWKDYLKRNNFNWWKSFTEGKISSFYSTFEQRPRNKLKAGRFTMSVMKFLSQVSVMKFLD